MHFTCLCGTCAVCELEMLAHVDDQRAAEHAREWRKGADALAAERITARILSVAPAYSTREVVRFPADRSWEGELKSISERRMRGFFHRNDWRTDADIAPDADLAGVRADALERVFRNGARFAAINEAA